MIKIIFSDALIHPVEKSAVSIRGEKVMPYPAGHRDRIRTKIVEAARTLFNRNGFESVSISQIMAAAGLTHGGFYGYFESKEDLYIEALSCFFTDPNWKNTWEGVEIESGAGQLGPSVVRAYLSRQHFENIEGSCPMVALPSDVARAAQKTKRAFEEVFGAMVHLLARDLQDGNGPAADNARAIAALCVGGMVVARAMDDRRVADELRQACMTVALRLGGWPDRAAAPRKGATEQERVAD